MITKIIFRNPELPSDLPVLVVSAPPGTSLISTLKGSGQGWTTWGVGDAPLAGLLTLEGPLTLTGPQELLLAESSTPIAEPDGWSALITKLGNLAYAVVVPHDFALADLDPDAFYTKIVDSPNCAAGIVEVVGLLNGSDTSESH